MKKVRDFFYWSLFLFVIVAFAGCGSGGSGTEAKSDGGSSMPQEVVVDTTPIPSSGDRVLAVESMGGGKWRLTLDGTGIEDPFFRGQSSLEEGACWKAYPVTTDPNFPGKLFVEVSWTNGFTFEFVFGTIGQWGQERNVVPAGSKYAYPLDNPDRFRVALTGNGAAADTVLGIEDKGSGEYWITLDFTPNDDLMASAYVTGLLGPNSDIWTTYFVEDLGNKQGRIKVYWSAPGLFKCKLGKMIPGPENRVKLFTPVGKYAVGDEIVIQLPLTN